MKFKNGMKVLVTEDQEGYGVEGLIGTIVVDFYEYDGPLHVGIAFNSKDFKDGHSLDGKLPRTANNGLWVEVSKLKPYNMVLENK